MYVYKRILQKGGTLEQIGKKYVLNWEKRCSTNWNIGGTPGTSSPSSPILWNRANPHPFLIRTCPYTNNHKLGDGTGLRIVSKRFF